MRDLPKTKTINQSIQRSTATTTLAAALPHSHNDKESCCGLNLDFGGDSITATKLEEDT